MAQIHYLNTRRPTPIAEPVDIDAWAAEHMLTEPPSTMERISAALNSPFWFGAYIGFIGGCFFTVIASAVWAVML